MTKQISFIHAADLHLDTPFQGLAHTPQHIFQDIQKSTFVALGNLVRTAIEKEVDFVLLVGDLFDHEKQSLKAQIHLRNAFLELRNYHIAVYLSYGNHDYVNGNIHPVTYPDNVYIFPDEKVHQFIYKRNGEELATIHGFSYENQVVAENKVNEYEVNKHHIPFHIATLHGSTQGNREHATYAPFQISELTRKNFNYWALGHIHQRQILKEDPLIVYPGNTQGRNRKEQGEKGCYYVKLSETDTEISFIPLQSIIFTSIWIDISSCQEIHQVERKIQQILTGKQEKSMRTLVDLHLTSENEDHQIWEINNYFTEVIEVINESNIHLNHWQYIFQYSFVSQKTNMDHLQTGDHFIGELTTHFEHTSIQPILKDLFNHRQGRKFLETLTEEEEEFIKSKASQILVEELLNSRR